MARSLAYVPAAILLVGCALTWHTRSQAATPLQGSLSTVLSDLPGYVITEQRLGDEERRVAGMSDYVARMYQRNGDVAFTTLVSYYEAQKQGKTIHSPRNCLPGAGWEVVSGGTRRVTVNGVTRTVNRYVLRNGRLTAVAYYWYQGRGRVTANEYVVKWNLLRDAALSGRTEEALVRIVVPVSVASLTEADGSSATLAADSTAQTIAARMMTDVDRVLPGPNARRS